VYDLEACPACGTGSATSFSLGGDLDLNRCRGCGLVYAPRYADPDEVYVDGYLTGGVGPFGLDLRDPRWQEMLAFVAARRLQLLERITGGPGRLLDVGCGSGEVLAVARDRGWTVAGVEPVAESARIACEEHVLDVRCATLDNAGFPERTFDVVSALHVVEHLPAATPFLRDLTRWVRPGGHVFIEVPNWRSMQRRNAGGQWIGLRPLEHVSHFTPNTIGDAMRRAGLVEVRTMTPSYLWKEQSLEQALGDLGLGRRIGAFRAAHVLHRAGSQFGAPAEMPSALGWLVLRAIGETYRAARVGMVIDAVGKVA
jgi:2-polyprenyl-3-methyl-5-hydroxy-6-metoxy-1,4-benzoquinol methylase